MKKNDIDYTVAVRTVGNGGEKYSKLLKSIAGLSPVPTEVLICLPDGVDPPQERIGTESFINLQRGMITQRCFVLQHVKTEYILFLDDDLEFDSNLIERLFEGILQGYDIVVGELLELLPPSKGIKKFIPIIHLGAVPTVFHKDRYVTVLKTTGYSYNRFVPEKGKILETQSAAGAMIFGFTKAIEKIHLEDELWAQHGAMAPMDDQITFFKAYRIGLKVGVATDAHFTHLDAKNATPSKETKMQKTYYSCYNRVVFWHRFIYTYEKNIMMKYCSKGIFLYYRLASSLFSFFRAMINGEWKIYLHTRKGYADGLRYIRTNEYHALPSVQEENE